MLAGVFWGAISLITPCVFPMIPITVSFFLKQSEKEHHRPVVDGRRSTAARSSSS